MGKIKKVKPPKASESTETQPQKRNNEKIPQLVSITASKETKTTTNSKTSCKPSEKISFEKTPKRTKLIRKKEKLKQKQKKFQSKIELFKQQSTTMQSEITKKKQLKHKKKQQQQQHRQNLTNNLKSLKDALPSLDELFQFKAKSADIKTGIAAYDIPKSKNQLKKDNQRKKHREMLERVKRFNELLKDPDYKKNARETIANHIKFSRDLSGS